MCDPVVRGSCNGGPNGAIRRKPAALIDDGRLRHRRPRQPVAGLLRVMRRMSSAREVYHFADRVVRILGTPAGRSELCTRPVFQVNQPIPSSHGQAIANAVGTDFGDVGRNVLRGPAQSNVDIALTRSFTLAESRTAEFRVEFFNLFNQVNLANPVSTAGKGTFSDTTGLIVAPGDFGRIVSTSSNPRLIQLAVKLNW